MENVKGKITHRQRQAIATRDLIVDTSRSLFLEMGYGAATIDVIAERAGVAVSTVYAIFKNKRGILKAIREAWHLASGQRDIYEAALDETNPERRLEMAAMATRRQWEMGTAMVTIYKGAATVDSEAAAELNAALQGRRANLDRFVSSLSGLVRVDLTMAQASSIFRALTVAEIYQEMVDIGGWKPDQYEAWLAATLKQQLLPSTKAG